MKNKGKKKRDVTYESRASHVLNGSVAMQVSV